VLNGDEPIAVARCIDDTELLAASYATGLRGGRVEGPGVRAIRSRLPELATHYDHLADRLQGVRVLESFVDTGGWEGLRLTELGRLFEDETLALFFSPPVQAALRSRGRAAPREPVLATQGGAATGFPSRSIA
jgi:oxygen-independent coproporphyrinogen III oxidase